MADDSLKIPSDANPVEDSEPMGNLIEKNEFMVQPHRDEFSSESWEEQLLPPLGAYYKDSSHLKKALDHWGKRGWYVPNITVFWEKFTTPTNFTYFGYRIRNAGAPVFAGEGMSAVIVMRRVTA